jgi:uncharacterized protein YkwD
MFAWLLFAAFAGGSLSGGSVEQDVLTQVNRYRAERSMTALQWSEAAAEEARGHCRNLLSGPVSSPHAGFEGRVARLKRLLSFRRAAENVGLLTPRKLTAETVVRLWVKSPDHRQNLEGAFERTGIGVVQTSGVVCATQILLGGTR